MCVRLHLEDLEESLRRTVTTNTLHGYGDHTAGIQWHLAYEKKKTEVIESSAAGIKDM